MRALHSLGLAAGLLFALASPAAQASEILFDGTFGNVTFGTPFIANANDGTVSGTVCSSCGDPTEALQFISNYSSGTGGDVYLTVLDNSLTYDPMTQGAITSLRASVDKDFTVTSPGIFNDAFRPLIEQDGQLYVDYNAVVFTATDDDLTTGYESIAVDFPASPFPFCLYENGDQTNCSDNPNFAGGPMTFGILSIAALFGNASSNSALTPFQYTADYDNLKFAINAPEPLTLSLFGVGILGAAAMRRRKARKAT